MDQLLDEVWAGPWAVALNPGWYGGDVPPQYKDLVASWEAAYSLMITATQVGGGSSEQGWGWRSVQLTPPDAALHDAASVTI